MTQKLGIAGVGAIGSAVGRALNNGIDGFVLEAISDPDPKGDFGVPNVGFDVLAEMCDLVVECLPAEIVPQLAEKVFAANKDIIFISSAALLIYPQIVNLHKKSESLAHLPSGALCGLDGVKAMKEMGIESATILSTKKPTGFIGAPHIVQNNIDLLSINENELLFEGNALDAAKGFPANINVAATLSLAGLGPEKNTCGNLGGSACHRKRP